jgi:hypothetical protein
MATNPAIALDEQTPRLTLIDVPAPNPPAQTEDAPARTPPANGHPANARERVAALASQAGLRLNHCAAWVLKIIGEEPALSNQEIAERAGRLAKGHASTLLARLARARLIENTRDHAASPIANAWRLTAERRELERAIREGMPGPVSPVNTQTLTHKLKLTSASGLQTPAKYETEAGKLYEAFPELAIVGSHYSKGAVTSAPEAELSTPAAEGTVEIKA